MREDMLFGETLSFWLELKMQADKLNYTDLIRDNAKLRAKVSYYENMFNQVNKYREVVDA